VVSSLCTHWSLARFLFGLTACALVFLVGVLALVQP
jgi:hypothetical protein